MRKPAQILLVAGAIGLSGTAIAAANPFGIATAQTSNDTTTTTPAVPAASPTAPSGAAPVRPDRAGVVDSVLKDLVTKGTITQQQADAIKSALDGAMPKGMPGGRGPGGPGGARGVFKVGLDSVAKALGMTTDELRTALAGGQSIADIAKTKNIDTKTIVDAIVKEADTAIDQAVTDGKLTADQATTAKSKAAEVAQSIVDGKGPFGGKGFGPGGSGPGGSGPGFRRGGRPPAPATAPATGQAPAASGSSTTPSITQDIFTY
jgi:polyhydroxyalkanoate synthesis regulator phasin